MQNLVLFLNSFLSYLLVFVVAIVVILVAIFLGVTLRKKKDAKAAIITEEITENVNLEAEEN